MSPATNKALRLIGHALAIAGVIFVCLRIADYYQQTSMPELKPALWITVVVTMLIYAGASLPLALAWGKILDHLRVNTSRLLVIRLYGQSQLAKYVPGNIMHLASRQAGGMAQGLPGRALAGSMAWELGLIAGTGALCGILLLPRWFPALTPSVAVPAFIVTLAATLLTLQLRLGRPIALAVGWQALFLLISGLIFTALLGVLQDSSLAPAQASLFCGAFVFSWLIGLLTPGAPAGIGVRESSLLLILGDIIPGPTLLLVVLLSRLVTAGGDLMFYILVTLLPEPDLH